MRKVLEGFIFGALSVLILVYIFCYKDITSSRKMNEISKIVDMYYYEDASDRSSIYNGALSGLDAYSAYYSEEDYKELIDDFNKVVGGIGIRMRYVEKYNQYYIYGIADNSPAYKADLRVGDIIYAVDDVVANNTPMSNLSELIRGTVGSTVKLTILREDSKIDIDIERDEVQFPVVYHKVYDGVGYIEIESFSATTGDEFSVALNEMRQNNIETIILDLRQNSGGMVEYLQDTVSQILPSCLLFTEVDNKGTETECYSESDLNEPEFNFVVLTSHITASCAEILASVFQDYNYGIVLGERTYGKGCVQSIIELGDGSAIKLTTAIWKTPKGKEVMGTGILPDIYVEDDWEDDDFLRLDYKNDSMLQFALAYIKD